jgi:hypothetical protein
MKQTPQDEPKPPFTDDELRDLATGYREWQRLGITGDKELRLIAELQQARAKDERRFRERDHILDVAQAAFNLLCDKQSEAARLKLLTLIEDPADYTGAMIGGKHA